MTASRFFKSITIGLVVSIVGDLCGANPWAIFTVAGFYGYQFNKWGLLT